MCPDSQKVKFVLVFVFEREFYLWSPNGIENDITI